MVRPLASSATSLAILYTMTDVLPHDSSKPFDPSRPYSVMQPLEALREIFGHHAFRATQADIIDHVISGRHALVIMPTGMGKSLCYQIPAVIPWPTRSDDQHPLVLVLSPLIALMKDQVDALQSKGIDAAFINSSLTRDQRFGRYQHIGEGRFQLLYVTPERFRKDEFLEVIASRTIRLLVVDEAHCISQWGHDFRPDYTRLADFRKLLGEPTTIALTATATPQVQQDILCQLGLDPTAVRIFHEGIDRPNLELIVHEVFSPDEKLEHIHRVLCDPLVNSGSTIIYFTLIRTLDEFSNRLREDGIGHVIYHGELDRLRRRSIQEDFMEGRAPLVLATNAFGMGIDKADIRMVMHADLPGSLEAYYQEIGRAGRDGLPSRCELLYDQRDLATQMEFIRWSNPDADFYHRVYDMLSGETEQIRAFGVDYLRERLHARDKHDHRLETALSMLDRYDVITGASNLSQLEILTQLPAALTNSDVLAQKLRGSQEKLLSLVEYVRHEGDRKAFLHDYFGLPYEPAP